MEADLNQDSFLSFYLALAILLGVFFIIASAVLSLFSLVLGMSELTVRLTVLVSLPLTLYISLLLNNRKKRGEE